MATEVRHVTFLNVVYMQGQVGRQWRGEGGRGGGGVGTLI